MSDKSSINFTTMNKIENIQIEVLNEKHWLMLTAATAPSVQVLWLVDWTVPVATPRSLTRRLTAN